MAAVLKVSSDVDDDSNELSSPLKILHENGAPGNPKKRKISEASESSESSESESDYDVIPSDQEDEEMDDTKEPVNKVANAMQQILSASGKSHILVPSQKKKKNQISIPIPRKKLWKDKYRQRDLGGSEVSHEKKLKTIATVGVVQLFASIETHKKKLAEGIEQANGEFARKRTLQEFDEDSFKNILDKRASKPVHSIDGKDVKVKAKSQTSNGKPGWAAITKHLIPQTSIGGWDEQSSDDE